MKKTEKRQKPSDVKMTPDEKKAVEEARRFAREIGLKGRLKLIRATKLLLENRLNLSDALGRPVEVFTRIEVGDGKGKPPELLGGSMGSMSFGVSSKFVNKMKREITQPMFEKADRIREKYSRRQATI
jgi:hypothetical protein